MKVKVAQFCLTLWDPTICSLPGSSVLGILQARKLERVAVCFSRGSSQPRDQTQVSRIAGSFFTSEPPGKPKNIGVGSLSLLQQIFLTQESNQGLLHCRRILNHLSYQGGGGGGGLVAKSCPTLVTPWTIACQPPLSMAFSRQEYWSGLPFLSPENLPNPGTEPRSPALHIYILKHLNKFNNQNTHYFNVILD